MRISDWSSDVCSSDLSCLGCGNERKLHLQQRVSRVAGAFLHQSHCRECSGRCGDSDGACGDTRCSAGLCSAIPGVGKSFLRTDRKSTRMNSSHYCASRMPAPDCKQKQSSLRNSKNKTNRSSIMKNSTD